MLCLAHYSLSLSLSHPAPLAGNCLILQQAGGETAATPMHVSLSRLRAWVGVGFGVTHKCCQGSSRGTLPRGCGSRQCYRSWDLLEYSDDNSSVHVDSAALNIALMYSSTHCPLLTDLLFWVNRFSYFAVNVYGITAKYFTQIFWHSLHSQNTLVVTNWSRWNILLKVKKYWRLERRLKCLGLLHLGLLGKNNSKIRH